MPNTPPPENLVVAALAELDARMGISPSGDEIQVKVAAICKLLADPPPMIAGYMASQK